MNICHQDTANTGNNNRLNEKDADDLNIFDKSSKKNDLYLSNNLNRPIFPTKKSFLDF